MAHSAGATARATRVSSGDRASMMPIETTKSSALPMVIGRNDSSPGSC